MAEQAKQTVIRVNNPTEFNGFINSKELNFVESEVELVSVDPECPEALQEAGKPQQPFKGKHPFLTFALKGSGLQFSTPLGGLNTSLDSSGIARDDAYTKVGENGFVVNRMSMSKAKGGYTFSINLL